MNRKFDFEWEFRDFKIRTMHKNGKDSPVRRNCPVELIKYNDETHTSCYVIAYWELLKDIGYRLCFEGNLPFDDITPEEIASIWVQLGAANKMLSEYYKACDREKELEYW